jgi:putative tricarboxylic transport membrane protein
MNSDRIFGLVVVFGALAMFAGALQIQTSFLSDPLGPKAFPLLISVVGVLAGLVIVMKPDADPNWPPAAAFGNMGIALVVLVGYAYALAPLGFLIPTMLASAAISYQISPNPKNALLTGTGLALVLFGLFKYGLGLGLVALPKALMG